MENKEIIKCIVDFVVNGDQRYEYVKPSQVGAAIRSKLGFKVFLESVLPMNPNYSIGVNLAEFVKNNIEAFSYYGIFPDGNKIIYNGKPVIIR